MESTIKSTKKELFESIVNKDSNRFMKIFNEAISDEYNKLVNSRFHEQVGSF